MASLYLAFLDGFQYGVDNGLGGLREGYLANDQRLGVQLLYLRAYLEHAAALAVVVFRHVDAAASREVGIEVELLAVKVGDGGIAYLYEVVREDFRA